MAIKPNSSNHLLLLSSVMLSLDPALDEDPTRSLAMPFLIPKSEALLELRDLRRLVRSDLVRSFCTATEVMSRCCC